MKEYFIKLPDERTEIVRVDGQSQNLTTLRLQHEFVIREILARRNIPLHFEKSFELNDQNRLIYTESAMEKNILGDLSGCKIFFSLQQRYTENTRLVFELELFNLIPFSMKDKADREEACRIAQKLLAARIEKNRVSQGENNINHRPGEPTIVVMLIPEKAFSSSSIQWCSPKSLDNYLLKALNENELKRVSMCAREKSSVIPQISIAELSEIKGETKLFVHPLSLYSEYKKIFADITNMLSEIARNTNVNNFQQPNSMKVVLSNNNNNNNTFFPPVVPISFPLIGEPSYRKTTAPYFLLEEERKRHKREEQERERQKLYKLLVFPRVNTGPEQDARKVARENAISKIQAWGAQQEKDRNWFVLREPSDVNDKSLVITFYNPYMKDYEHILLEDWRSILEEGEDALYDRFKKGILISTTDVIDGKKIFKQMSFEKDDHITTQRELAVKNTTSYANTSFR